MKNIEVSELSHSDLMSLVSNGDEGYDKLIIEYLDRIASSFSLEEIFDMIAYVDTPDVLG